MAELDISKIMEDISIKVQEKEESFIFETVRSFCNNVLMEYKMEITKEDLKRALLLYKEYDNRLKADLEAILVELQMEIHELENPYPHEKDNLLPLASHNAFYEAKSEIEDLVEEKINALKGGK